MPTRVNTAKPLRRQGQNPERARVDWFIQQALALPARDRNRLRNALRVYDVLEPVTATPHETPADTAGDYLLAGIRFELRRRRLLSKDGQIRTRLLTATFHQEFAEVRALLKERLPNVTTDDLEQFGRLAAEALAAYLESWSKMTVSDRTLTQQVGEIPAAIDRAYPGYLKSGLLCLLIQRERIDA